MAFFENSESLQAAFDLQPPYYDPIALTDSLAGFSVKRNYPMDIAFKPVFKKNGKPEDVAVIWINYLDKFEEKNESANLIPITARIAKIGLYINKHFDYDFDDEDSPSKEQLEASQSTPSPLELEFNQEFFFDIEAREFKDRFGASLSGREILDRVFQEHCDTVHWLRGFELKSKLAFRDKATGVITALIGILKILLEKGFGRTITDNEIFAGSLRRYDRKTVKKTSEENLDIFGYKAPKHLIVFYAMIMAGISYFKSNYIEKVFRHEALYVTYTIIGLWILDSIMPEIIFLLMNSLISVKKWLAFLRFNVFFTKNRLKQLFKLCRKFLIF